MRLQTPKGKKMTKINKKGESFRPKFIFVDIGRKKREKFKATTFWICDDVIGWHLFYEIALKHFFSNFFLSFRHFNFYSKLIFVEYHLYKPLYYGNNSKIYPHSAKNSCDVYDLKLVSKVCSMLPVIHSTLRSAIEDHFQARVKNAGGPKKWSKVNFN